MPMMSSDLRWYVARTKRYKESYVQSQLRYVDIEAYFPLVKISRRYLGKGQRQIEPFFPGYVFVRLDLATQTFRLRQVHDFISLVCFGGKTAWLDSNIIQEFRRKERGRGYINIRPEQELFRRHDPVRIIDGPFTGCAGLFERYLPSSQRICILVDVLKLQARLELPLNSVVAALSPSSTQVPQRV